MNTDNFLYKDLSYLVIGAAMDIHNELGSGFVEKAYERALCIRLNELKIKYKQQVKFELRYHGKPIGDYISDLVIDDKIILELKTTKAIDDVHIDQLINYLKASGLRVGYLINFAKRKLEYQRYIH